MCMPCVFVLTMYVVKAYKNYLVAGMIALGDSSHKEASPIAVLTVSAVLWSFLGLFPFIQV